MQIGGGGRAGRNKSGAKLASCLKDKRPGFEARAKRLDKAALGGGGVFCLLPCRRRKFSIFMISEVTVLSMTVGNNYSLVYS